MERFGCICSNWGFQCGHWWMCRQTAVLLVHMCSGFPAGRSKQMIMTSSSKDITRISCATLGGNYKRRVHQNLGLSSGPSDTECLGLLTSHRPSTPAILVPLVEQSITRMNCVFCVSICMYPDLSGELLVSVNLVD